MTLEAITFGSPWVLLLLLALPAARLAERRHRAGSVRFPTTVNLRHSGRSLRQRLLWLPAALRYAALALLVVALARPQQGVEQVREVSQGIAIAMVVDRSGSMRAEMEFAGQRLNRLDVVKRVFQDFVLGDGRKLDGRPNDLIGMIVFGTYPDTVCPLTLAHGALPEFLKTVKIPDREDEGNTALGDALALAAARLKRAEDDLAAYRKDGHKPYTIRSKVIILLTDGRQTAGTRHPLEGARIAKDWGIKVYTIGIGGNEAVHAQNSLLGQFLQLAGGNDFDEPTLKAIAEATGGLYRRADSADALREVYEEIDRLEKTEVESVRYTDYRERFVPFALAALALLLAEVLIRTTWLRRTP